jgi:NAD(P)-dependent dehydrogenase (short-subunit alcohol dehydrogenase family)
MAGFSFDLTGRVALVTGASSGIGRRFALQLAASGAKVVIAARRVALLEELRAEIEGAGGEALAVAMDVTDEASTVAAYDAAEAAFGTVDTVVANAGIAHGTSSLGMAMELFDQTVAVNLRGVFLTAREGAKRMIRAGSADTGRGRVVLISSITAQHVSPHTGAYAATKAGVLQLGRSFAKDWALRGVNVNIVCPGYILTDINAELWDHAEGKKLLARFVRPRVMDAGALDPMLLYLCSDASAQVTGSVFTIDDGQTL